MKTKRLLFGAMAIVCLLASNFSYSQNGKKVRGTSDHPTIKYKKHASIDAATLITFSEFPVGTVVTNQYADKGIIFGPGSDANITGDVSNPTSPVLSGTPLFEGDITGSFVLPGTSTPTTVESFQLDGGYFDGIGTTRLEWYDLSGNSLGYMDNTQQGIETFTVTGSGIASFKMSAISFDLFAIDNVSFESAQMAYNICLKDGFDYKWQLSYVTTGKVRNATGTVDIGGGTIWNAWGYWNKDNTKLELHAINPAGDNCASGSTDSFVYVGTGGGFYDGNYNDNPVFSGTGSWTSYCGADEVNYGTFYLEDCDHGNQIPLRKEKDGVTPARSKGNVISFSMKISPNPVRNNATINYSLTKESKVSIVIYDYMMQPVKTLVSGSKTAGKYSVNWDGRKANGASANSGLYKVVAVIDGKSYSAGMQVVR